MKNDKGSIWLYRSLENHSLSQKLSWLLSDKNHLKSCYQSHAFLQQEKYTEALLVCLRAVERNQPSLMSEINPSLFLSKVGAREFHKIHRRCSSFPDSHLKQFEHNCPVRTKTMSFISSNHSDELDFPEEACSSTMLSAACNRTVYGKIKPWNSMPSLQSEDKSLQPSVAVAQCRTTPSTPVHTRALPKFSPSALKENYTSLQNSKRKSYPKKIAVKKSSKAKHIIIDNYDIVEHTPPLSSSQSSGTYANDELGNLSTKSLPETKSPMKKIISLKSVPEYARTTQAGQKDYKRHPKKSFIEDGGMSIQPVVTG